ncbi:MAG: 4Fe-4S binding protein [Clostridia bacterium]|nr:4Fe-4S binding protein [Clostridia bacterium]
MATKDELVYAGEKGRFTLYTGLCKGCGLCIEKCPTGVLDWNDVLGVYGTPSVLPVAKGKVCTGCGICQQLCPDCAIKVERTRAG